MITKFSALFFLCLLSISVAQNKINFEFDYARFNYDSSSVYLEIYYSLGQENLTYHTVNDSIFGEAIIHIIIQNSETNDLYVDKMYRVNSILNQNEITKNLIGVLGFRMEKGNYYLEIKAYDVVDTTNSITLTENLTLRGFYSTNLLMSDIQLASRIITESDNINSIFYKNTLEVVPNPVNIFGQTYPMLFYYAEIYNLLQDTIATELLLNRQIINSLNQKVYENSKFVRRNNDSIVEVGAVNLAKFPTGSYTLILNLLDEFSKVGISSSKKFFVFNPGVKDSLVVQKSDLTVKGSEFGVMSEEECDDMFDATKYISSEVEIKQYKKLSTVDSKREFLYNFWRARDIQVDTPQNEFKNEFMQRIEFVEARYKTFTKRGIKTDRGRTYLMYGEPDEIELHPNDYDKKPYEIWYYHGVEGGVLFVFGDITGYSDYELIHSTKRGEMRDDNWVRRITAN